MMIRIIQESFMNILKSKPYALYQTAKEIRGLLIQVYLVRDVPVGKSGSAGGEKAFLILVIELLSNATA